MYFLHITTKLTCRQEAQRIGGQVQRFVMMPSVVRSDLHTAVWTVIAIAALEHEIENAWKQKE